MTTYTQEEKELAHAIDPACWESYSGRELVHKQAMEARRKKALREAQEQLAPQREAAERLDRPVTRRELIEIIEWVQLQYSPKMTAQVFASALVEALR